MANGSFGSLYLITIPDEKKVLWNVIGASLLAAVKDIGNAMIHLLAPRIEQLLSITVASLRSSVHFFTNVKSSREASLSLLA